MANEVNNAGKACKRLMPGPLRRPGPSKRPRMVLQRDDQAGQALEVQPVVLSNLQSHAKLCKGDGKVQLVVLTNSQSQAKLSKCDGEEQPVLLTNLQSQAKLFMGDGEEQPVVLSDLQSQANLAKPWPRFGLWCRMRQECPSCCGGRSGGRAPGGLEAASAVTAWPAGV